MLEEWQKFRGWLVLEHFLRNPNEPIHINGLSRELKISPRTAETYLLLYSRDALLSKENVGNTIQYSLRNETAVVQALKKFYFIQKLLESGLVEKFCKENTLVSFVVYGSYANGNYSDKSDLDFLVISNRMPNVDLLNKMSAIFGAEAQVTQFSIGEWRKMSREKEKFAESIQRNYILLRGADI